MRVLLVEPDTVLATIYARALQAAGHVVVAARTAQAAIHAADDRRPDFVILEMQLVSHSGVEFLYELRSYGEWQDIPVIIHSLVPPGEFSGSRELLSQLGVTGYLYKPQTSLQQLCASVKSVAAAVH